MLVAASIGFADSRQVLEQLRTVDPRWLGVAFAIGLLQIGLLGLRWSRVAAALGLRLSWLKATMEYALSLLGNQVLPSGIAGDGLRGLRHSKSASDGSVLLIFEALALDRVSGQLALWLVVLLSAPLTLAAGIVDLSSLGLGLLVLCVGAAGSWLLLSRIARFRGHATRFAQLLRRSSVFLLSPKGAAVHLPLSLLLVGLTLLQVYVAARAIGVVLPWLQLLWLGPLILVAASVPSFFGGWGIREGASALLFAAAGMPQSTGVAVSMVYGSFALVISLPGFMVLLFDGERTPSPTSRPWVYASAFSMIAGALLALWLSYPPVLGFVSALCFFILVAQARGNWTPDGGFGVPNLITTLRLGLTMGLLFFYQHQEGIVLAVVALSNILLDAVDGWLARRTGQSSEFGAHYDIEADALLVLTLTVILFGRGVAGSWVILAGLWRYLYVLAPACFPTPVGQAPRSRHGRIMYVLMIVCFMLALVTPQEIGQYLALLGTVATSLSFLHSFWVRYTPAPVA
jgi:glycosyltransferase 2 family protein